MSRSVFRTAFLIICLLPIATCAISLPDVERIEQSYPSGPPVIVGPRGQLPERQTQKTIEQLKHASGSPELLEEHISLMQSLSGYPLTSGNKARLLVDGPATNAAMFNAISRARDHINLETFIFENDEIGRKMADLLLQKQTEGVQVNLIYDSIGSKTTPLAFFNRLKDAGVNVLEFNPINPLRARGRAKFVNRDHRKSLIVDGKIAFTGGINISDVYSHSPSSLSGSDGKAKESWRDTHLQIEGPAVAQVQRLFLETWAKQRGRPLAQKNYYPAQSHMGNDFIKIIGSAPGDKEALTYIMYLSAIKKSEEFIHLTMAYLIPDDEIKKALIQAVQRGVDVKIILPGWSDSNLTLYAGRSHYDELLQAGVKLYEMQKGMLHAKTAVIDRVWSTVGSTNMEMWSFLRNNEINAIILSIDFADKMETLFEEDLGSCKAITKETWSQRPVWNHFIELFARMVSYWL